MKRYYFTYWDDSTDVRDAEGVFVAVILSMADQIKAGKFSNIKTLIEEYDSGTLIHTVELKQVSYMVFSRIKDTEKTKRKPKK